MYTYMILSLINQWLLNLIFGMTKALNVQNSSKQHFQPPPLSTFQCSLERPASVIAWFPLYSLPFSFQTLEISSDATPVEIT